MLYIISGLYKNHKIHSPKTIKTRPTTGKLREALFNICQNYIEGALFLDVFAGSGAMGLEALSRGAKKATFIDAERECIHCIRENLKLLHLEQKGHPLHGDFFVLINKLQKQGEKYDIIYMDPPYEISGLVQKLIKAVDEGDFLLPGGRLFVEESKAVLLDNEKWRTLRLKSKREMGRSQLLEIEKLEIYEA